MHRHRADPPTAAGLFALALPLFFPSDVRLGVDLEQAAARAADAIRARPRGTRWLLASDADADGICAAAVMAHALRRIGHGVQLRASRDKDAASYSQLAHAVCDAYMLLDKGSSHLDVLADLARRTDRVVLVIDHHGLPDEIPSGVLVVNPRQLGLDGSRDASASTTAAAVALAMDADNLELAGTALAGAVGDWQHRGGWRGWNQQLIDRALAAGHLERRLQPNWIGLDLAAALGHAQPPVPGIAGRAEAVALLRPLGLADELDVEGLDAEQQGRLVTAVVLQHLAHGVDIDPAQLMRPTLHDVRLRTGVRHLFRLMDACGRRGDAATAFAYLLGQGSARAEVERHFAVYASALAHAVARLEAEGTAPRAACQIAWTDSPELTGMVGGLGVTHFLADIHRPAVVLAPRPDGDVQISTRGTNEAVARGLDLGAAVAAAARTVGRDGGGHPVAAGTVVPQHAVDPFIEALDAILVTQGFLPDTL